MKLTIVFRISEINHLIRTKWKLEYQLDPGCSYFQEVVLDSRAPNAIKQFLRLGPKIYQYDRNLLLKILSKQTSQYFFYHRFEGQSPTKLNSMFYYFIDIKFYQPTAISILHLVKVLCQLFNCHIHLSTKNKMTPKNCISPQIERNVTFGLQ